MYPIPPPTRPTPRLAWLALVAVLGAVEARAQDENLHFQRQTTFRIPFQIDPGDRRVQQVILHVSEDQGRTYQQAGTATPADRGFTFNARHDGWFYFTVQTRDVENRLFPPVVDRVEPGLRVFVDTRKPSVKLRQINPEKPGEVAIEWDLRDEYLELNSLRLDYRAGGRDWAERGILRAATGQLSFDAGGNGPVEVRLSVKDRAGNIGEDTLTLRSDGGQPMPKVNEDDRKEHDPTLAGVRKVNNKKVSLDYKIDDVGPSDVSVVEVYMRKDAGPWQKYKENASRKPPFVIEVEGEGRYGFTLLAKSGVGLGERPPQAGDAPQVWIEVDLTKPDVRLGGVIVGRGAEHGNLTISWTATDKNLSRQPISLFYSSKPDGPWLPIPNAANLENGGRHVWRMQDGVPYEFYVKVEALDEAGNVGFASTPETVKVDLSMPRARVTGVEPAKP